MHHRIMVRKERESKIEIAGFGGLKPQIPAISNAAESEKQTLAQSLRALFTDDAVGVFVVARMERSEIRGTVLQLDRANPDCASLHPGYARCPAITRSSVPLPAA